MQDLQNSIKGFTCFHNPCKQSIDLILLKLS